MNPQGLRKLVLWYSLLLSSLIKRTANKNTSISFLSILTLLVVALFATVHIGTKNAYADETIVHIGQQDPGPALPPGSSSTYEQPKPYWVYMRVKQGVTDYSDFSVAGQTVDGECAKAGGFFISYARTDATPDPLTTTIGTVANSNRVSFNHTTHDWSLQVEPIHDKAAWQNDINIRLNGSYATVGNYDTTRLEPVYLVFDYNKNYDNNGAIYKEDGVLKKNLCSIHTSRNILHDPVESLAQKTHTQIPEDEAIRCNYNRLYHDYGSSYNNLNWAQLVRTRFYTSEIETDIMSYIIDQWEDQVRPNLPDGGFNLWESKSGDNAWTGARDVIWFCAGIVDEPEPDPEEPEAEKVKFTASISRTDPANTTKIGTKSFLGKYETKSYRVSYTGAVNRSDSNSNVSKAKAKARFLSCKNSQKSSCKDMSTTNFNGDLAINGKIEDTINAGTSEIDPGGSKTICRALTYMGSASILDAVQTDGSWKKTSVSCYTVYRPARATFTGTVAVPSSNNDTNIVSSSGSNLLGNGIATSFKLKTTYTLKRTNDNPEDAQAKYTTSSSSQPSSASTKSNVLAKNETQTITASSTKTVSQAVGTKSGVDDYCFYMTYEKNIDYYNNGSKRLDDRYDLSKIKSCATIYNPTYADILGSIQYTAVGMAGNAEKGFYGNGYDTSYAVTAHYQLERIDDRSPTNATSNFDTNTAASDTYDSTKYPAAPSSTLKATKLSQGKKYDYPVEFTISLDGVAQGSTITKCSYLTYNNRKGYIKEYDTYSVLKSPFNTVSQSQTYRCVKFTNPYKYTATFSASISATNGSYLSGTTNANLATNNRTGNGLYGQYTIRPTYTITRDNDTGPEIGVTSRYATSDSAQPTSSNAVTAALARQKSSIINGSSKTIDVDIGGTVTQCFYISYDNQVTLVGKDATGSSSGDVTIGKVDNNEDRTFGGKQWVCYKITNPAQTYTAHYSASSTGLIDAHTWLNRYNNNTLGVLDNAVRISGTNSDQDGSYIDHFPKRANGTADDVYTISFTHKISRTDEDKSSTASTVYYVATPDYQWQVQDCQDAACDANVYSAYSATRDTNSSRAVSGRSKLSAGGSSEINTQAKFTFNANNKGKYLKYCQRLVYSATATFTSATDPNNRNWHLDQLDEDSIKTASYTAPVCVVIRNPNWSEADSTTKQHYIDLLGSTGDIHPSGAQLISGNSYEALTIEPTFLFDHSVTRYDNNTVRNSNFDESNAQAANTNYYTNNPSTGVAFFQPSIYGNPNYNVHTSSDDSRMHGTEKLPDTRNTVKLINPLKLKNGKLEEIDGREIVLNASDKDHSESWKSNANDGRTRIAFNGIDRATLNTSNARDKDLAYHSLMAGDTKQFNMGTYTTRAAWYVEYKEIKRQESYAGSWMSSTTGSQIYNRTEKVSASPQLTTPTGYDSREKITPTTYSVYRPYNFKISNIENANVDTVALSGETYTVDYTISVERENDTHKYITDPNHTGEDERYVYVVGYVVNADVTIDQLQTLTPSRAPIDYSGDPQNDLCSSINRNSFINDCNVLTTGHPTKVSKKQGQTADPGSSFKHVYDLNNYQLSYTTGSITVPDLHAGQKYCVAIAIRNYSSASGSYYLSTSSCRNISKRPALQVWGSSIMSNGGISTTTSSRGGFTFGSWADYLIVANGDIRQMASGASYISGARITTSTCTTIPNPLTISNAYCNSSSNKYLGRASVNTRLNTIERYQEFLAGNTTLGELPQLCTSAECHYSTNSGSSYVIRTEGDIVIDKNIINNYANSQVVIMANNIKIDESVTRIDAILIATGSNSQGGTIDTCENYAADAISTNVCTERLTINGAVIGKDFLLKRTAGGDPISSIKEPAELINSRPSLYIWGYDRSTQLHNPRIVYTRTLPPRY